MPTPGDPWPPTRSDEDFEPVAGDTLLGRYRWIRPLGHGAQGSVWRAYDETLGRDVAIKFTSRSEDLGAVGQARSRKEAKLLARADHGNLVRVWDVQFVGDRQILIMQLIDGVALASLVSQAPLPASVACSLVEDVAAGLAHLHAMQIVHRDVKPANVIVDRAIVARLGDFGIARAIEDPRLTTNAGPIGTMGYIAPELFKGDSASPASDIYSLGSLFFVIIHGRLRDGAEPVPLPPPVPFDDVAHALTELITAMMSDTAADRPSAAQVCETLSTMSMTDQSLRDSRRVVLGVGSCNAANHLEVFAARGAELRNCWLQPDNHWSDWWGMPAPDEGEIVSLASASHTEWQHELIAVTLAGAVWHRWKQPDADWSDWGKLAEPPEQFAGVAASSCATTRRGRPGNLTVVARSSSGKLFRCKYTAGEIWTDWKPFDTPSHAPFVALAATRSHTEGQQDLAALTTDGDLWTTYQRYGDGWAPWERRTVPALLTNVALTGPAVRIAGRSGLLELFAVDVVGRIWHRWFLSDSGTWSEWAAMAFPGRVVSLAAGSKGDGHQEIFVWAEDGSMWHRWWLLGSGWSDWTAFRSCDLR